MLPQKNLIMFKTERKDMYTTKKNLIIKTMRKKEKWKKDKNIAIKIHDVKWMHRGLYQRSLTSLVD
jgi:hypothetical protein